MLDSGADDSGDPDELSGGWLASPPAASEGGVIPASPGEVGDEPLPHAATQQADAIATNVER
jgi:hypothetical protein